MSDKTITFTEQEYEFIFRFCKRANRLLENNMTNGFLKNNDENTIKSLISKLQGF